MAKEEKRGLFGSLRIKLLLCFLALALIPVLVISVVAYKSSGNSLRTQFLNSFTAIVQSREDTLTAYLRGKIGRVVDFGSDGYIRDTIENIDQKGDDLAQLSEQLTKYRSTNKMLLTPEICEILFLHRDGRGIGHRGGDRRQQPAQRAGRADRQRAAGRAGRIDRRSLAADGGRRAARRGHSQVRADRHAPGGQHARDRRGLEFSPEPR